MNLSPNTFEEIIELLKACDDAYFNEEGSQLSDREYDILKRKAFMMDPSDDYFIKVGSDVRGGKIKLPYTMGSLNQVYEGEVSKWVEKYSLQDRSVVVTDKLDGVSCMLVYNKGLLSIAYSRGNGIEGADITRHVESIPTVPTKLDGVEYLVVRAEVILDEDIFAEKYAEKYRNSRNMTAGAMNRKETDLSILRDLEVIAYEIVAGTIDGEVGVERKPKCDTMGILRKLGFKVVNGFVTSGESLTDKWLASKLDYARKQSKYILDGLVVTVNDHANLNNQSDSSSLNPEHSIKYKVLSSDDIVETVVKGVHWEVSKSGYLKPRVEIYPVELFGTTVKFATGFNAAFIRDKGIGKGSRIKITKSGMVIPFIVSVLESVTPDLPDANLFGAWEYNETGVEAVLIDKEADSIVFKQVLDFFETFKIDLLKEATLQTIWETVPSKKYDDAICDICDYTESEWVKIIGSNGSKIYKSLNQRMQAATLETFLGASRYMGVGFGVRKGKALLSGVVDPLKTIWTISEAEIVAKDGFDTKTAQSVLNGLKPSKALLDRLMDAGVLNIIEEKKTMELNTLNVVMTGFRDAELQYKIESKGGKVSSGVSKKTTHLLALDANSGSGKAEKAKELGVKVMTPEQFKFEFDL